MTSHSSHERNLLKTFVKETKKEVSDEIDKIEPIIEEFKAKHRLLNDELVKVKNENDALIRHYKSYLVELQKAKDH